MQLLEHVIEAERLATPCIAAHSIPRSDTDAWLEKSFKEALPRAMRLVELTEEFLEQKDAEWNALAH